MNKKVIAYKRAKDFIYYREVGELPTLRKINKKAKENRVKNRLDLACERLSILLTIPECVQNYERKQAIRGY